MIYLKFYCTITAITENTQTLGKGDFAMVGEWTVNEKMEQEIPADIQKIFDKWKIIGVVYLPLTYVASQVVQGVNYMFICKTTTKTSKPIIGSAKVVLNDFQNEVRAVTIEPLV